MQKAENVILSEISLLRRKIVSFFRLNFNPFCLKMAHKLWGFSEMLLSFSY